MSLSGAKRPGSLVIEPRDGNDVVELAVAFTVKDGLSTWAGERLSRKHLIVRASGSSPASISHDVRSVEVFVPLGGYELRLPMLAVLRPLPDAPGLFVFDIVDTDQLVEVALGQLIRSLVIGFVPDAQDFLSSWDEETPRHAPAAPRAGNRRSWLVLAASVLLAALALFALGYQGVAFLTQVRSRTAAVTAQRIDFVSPEYGIVGGDVLRAGARVAVGDHVATIASPAVEAELASAALAPETPADLRQMGLRRALERRLASLTFTAKCICAVLWSAIPGTNVAPGALVASLVVTDPAEVTVEALVQASVASGLIAGARANISWSTNPAGIGATVDAIRFDTTPVAKVGLGPDRAQSATVILKANDPTQLPIAGTPVTVVIYK
jgi:hypothetical protein